MGDLRDFCSVSIHFRRLLGLLLFISIASCSNAKDQFHETSSHKPERKIQANEPQLSKAWQRIQKIVLVILENTDFEDAYKQHFLKQLSAKGALMRNFFAITHPSQPNYIAMISGDLHNVSDDSNVTINAPHLGDLLEASNKTWKSYAEGFPGNCFLGAEKKRYYRKHVPFLSFANIQNQPGRCAKVVNANQFLTDLQSNSLPNFSYYTPDIYNDGHDTGIAYADRWLSHFFKPILADTQNPGSIQFPIKDAYKDTLFIVTFDEGSNNRDNRILTLFIGAGVKAGAVSDRTYDHYSLLRTIEDIFALNHLGNHDQSATPIQDIWEN